MTTFAQSQQHYQQQSASTAGPAQLILMLLDRTLVAIERSTVSLSSESPDYELVHFELTRAQDIVTELSLALDHEQGGKVAGQLEAVYDWCIRELVKANTLKDALVLDPINRVIGDIRDGWYQGCVMTEMTA